MVGRHLAAGDLEATFLAEHGMLCASLRHRGTEILRRVDDLDGAAAKGSTAGIALLYPWANRLDGLRYRAAGRDVALDPSSPLLHLDERGLPIHGVPWSRLTWEVGAASDRHLAAQLEWVRPELLAIFPFRHRLELVAMLEPGGLRFETTLLADAGDPVPVSFGFHPYFGLRGPRASWRLRLPAMRRLALDARQIPTGVEEAFAGCDAALAQQSFDDGFALPGEGARFVVADGELSICVELLAGYRFGQVFAPRDQDFVALEPMAAPTNALASGRGLPVVEPGGRFRAAFRIGVDPRAGGATPSGVSSE